MQSFTFTYEKYDIEVFMLSKESCPCIYCTISPEDAKELTKYFSAERIVLVTISNAVWENDLAPWPAVKAFSKGKDFGGRGDDYLHLIKKKIMPKVEQKLSFTPSYNIAAGYSLAGLWSLYAAYKTNIFSHIVCASGSLWYDGFIDFMQNNKISSAVQKVYFSLGDREKHTKNQRLATVEECTLKAETLLRQHNIDTIFVKNPGGHFNNSIERLAKGIYWALKD